MLQRGYRGARSPGHADRGTAPWRPAPAPRVMLGSTRVSSAFIILNFAVFFFISLEPYQSCRIQRHHSTNDDETHCGLLHVSPDCPNIDQSRRPITTTTHSHLTSTPLRNCAAALWHLNRRRLNTTFIVDSSVEANHLHFRNLLLFT